MSEFLRGQLYAVRSQIDAILAQLEPQQDATAVSGCPKCGAPEDQQVSASTLGEPGLRQCLQCRAEYQV